MRTAATTERAGDLGNRMMAGGPSRSVEVELSFDVDETIPLPDWSSLPGVAVVGDPEPRDLDAAYFDTADLALGRAGVAVRRRTGGPDAGWHIKGPKRDGARVELHWPLGDPGVPPDALIAELPGISGLAEVGPLTPVARIRNARTAFHLYDARGRVLAEFVDDRVDARDERGGTERSWREWEFELVDVPAEEASRLLEAATTAILAAGAQPAASDSKLARALGH